MPDDTFTCLPNHELRAQGAAILRISAELRAIITEDEGLVDDSVLADLDKLDAAGQWLRSASNISLSAGQPTTLSPSDDPVGPGPTRFDLWPETGRFETEPKR